MCTGYVQVYNLVLKGYQPIFTALSLNLVVAPCQAMYYRILYSTVHYDKIWYFIIPTLHGPPKPANEMAVEARHFYACH